MESAISPPTPNKQHHKKTPQSEPLTPATEPFSRAAWSNAPRANSGPTPTTRSSPLGSSDPSDIHSEAHSTSHAPIIRELLPRAFPRPLFLKYHLPWTGSHPPKPSRRDRRIENRRFQNLRPSSISSRIPFRPGFVFARTLRASSIQFSPAFSSPFFGPTKRAATFPLRVITTSCPPPPDSINPIACSSPQTPPSTS